MHEVLPWVTEQRSVPTLTVLNSTVKILIVINITIGCVLWYERTGLKQTVDIAPVHTSLSQVVTLGITNRNVLTDGDDIEVLSLQEHVVTVDTDGVTSIVRSSLCTHDTFVTGVGVRHSELTAVSTTSQSNRMILLNSILVLECTPPVSAFPATVNSAKNVRGNETCPIQLRTRSIKGVLVDDSHILLSIEQLRTLIGI